MKYWIEEKGVCTPGGDPYWICPECGGGGHCYGVEQVNGPYDHCPNCNIELLYPWERFCESNKNVNMLNLQDRKEKKICH